LPFAYRLSTIVHESTYHCDPSDFQLSFIERRIADYMIWRHETNFGWKQGLLDDRLLCGYCHQRAYLLAKHLQKNGIDAITYGLTGHVVVLAILDGSKYLLDPDYGTVPMNYQLEGDALKSEIYAAYASSAWDNSAIVYPMIASRGDNRAYNPGYIDAVAENQLALRALAHKYATASIVLGIFILLSIMILILTLLTGAGRTRTSRSFRRVEIGGKLIQHFSSKAVAQTSRRT